MGSIPSYSSYPGQALNQQATMMGGLKEGRRGNTLTLCFLPFHHAEQKARGREHVERSPHQHDQPTHSLPYFQTAAVVSNGAGMFALKQTQKRIKWSMDHFYKNRPLISLRPP